MAEQDKPDADGDVEIPEANAESSNVVERNDDGFVNVTEDGGIMKKILQEGAGDPPPNGADVFCHYTGTLVSNGKKFDSSRDRGDPFSFQIGKGQVISGWDNGIITMRKGERAILRCRYDYAYGERGSPPNIPAKSDLDFDVELIDWDNWKQVNSKKDFKKLVVKEGEGGDYDTPKEDGKARITYVVRLNDSNGQVVMQGDDIEFLVDDDDTFPEGFHTAVKDTQKGSTVEFAIASDYMWGEEGNAKLGVPPNCNIYLQLTVSDFTNPKDNWEMEVAEKWTTAKAQKDEGNAWFKSNQLSRAAKRYQKAWELVENFTKDDRKEADIEANDLSEFKLNVLNNLALVNFKLQKYEDAVEKATEAIKLDEKNVKALTRRGQAQMAYGNLDEAKDDFKKALECEPDEQEKRYIQQQLKLVNGKLKEYKSKQRKIYSGMFK